MIKSFLTYIFFLLVFISCSSPSIIHKSEMRLIPNSLVVSTYDSLKQVPIEIRMIINCYLISKVGQENTEKFSFVNGVKTKLKSVYEYRTIYQFSDLESDLKSYEFEILLDSCGNVLNEVNLPNNIYNINKFSIISLDSAIVIAQSKNFNFDEIDFDYLKDIDSFAWIFKKPGYSYSFWLFVNANTGEIVEHKIYDVWY
jgi:hypothetical protein